MTAERRDHLANTSEQSPNSFSGTDGHDQSRQAPPRHRPQEQALRSRTPDARKNPLGLRFGARQLVGGAAAADSEERGRAHAAAVVGFIERMRQAEKPDSQRLARLVDRGNNILLDHVQTTADRLALPEIVRSSDVGSGGTKESGTGRRPPLLPADFSSA